MTSEEASKGRDDLTQRLQASLGDAYTIERELGGGGMSRVFLAEETRFKRRVVIKVLSPELAAGLSAERFEREIGLAAGLQHAHIVPVIAAGEVGGLPWYSMPFVDGSSLRERLVQGPIPAAECVKILGDVARSLAYAHGRGIVHRDIKPENVLLSGGVAVVTDFGIAKALTASKTQAPGGTLTQVGTSLGTPAYMAPEQAAGDDVDHRADLYAWGVMAYEMLGGRHPFAGKTTAQQLIAAHITERPALLTTITKDVPSPLEALVMRCLEKDPAQRPASANTLLATLDTVHTGATVTAPRQRIRPWHLVAAVVVLASVGAGLAMTRRDARAQDAASVAVLPFENRGPAEQSIFADGLTDAVTEKLIGVSGLMVIDSRSSATYKGTTKSASQIGSELGVAYVLSGVVTWAKDAAGAWRAQVRPTLVRTRDGVAQWAGEPVVVTPTDPFTAQSEIASKVVSAIGVAIQARERASLATAPTKSPEAYELYLRAHAIRMERPDDGKVSDLAEAARHLERATRLDPSFAIGFAELAHVEYSRQGAGDSTAGTRFDAAVMAALALDPGLAEAHFALARRLWFHESRFQDAGAEIARASAAKPGDARILSYFGTFQVSSGQLSEGLANIERSTVLDPLDRQSNVDAVYFYTQFRRFDDAERHAERVLALLPAEWRSHESLLKVALARGDTVRARLIMAAAPTPVAGAGFWRLPLYLTVAGGRLPVDGQLPNAAPPGSLTTYTVLGAWAREAGQLSRARAWFDSAVKAGESPRYALAGRASGVLGPAGMRAIAFAGTGRIAEARRAIAFADSIERLNALPNEPQMADAQQFLAYAQLMLGDREPGIARLERMLVLPSGNTPVMLRNMWPYASLHGDPRFRKIAEMDK